MEKNLMIEEFNYELIPELCALFNIDEYMQWLINTIDAIDDKLISLDETNITKILELTIMKNTLIQARDKYYEMKREAEK